MQRRNFLKTLSSGLVLLAAKPLTASARSKKNVLSLEEMSENPLLRFGIVTDTHYAEKATANNRFYQKSILKLQEAVKVFNQANLDFAIELGDLKDMGLDKREKDTLRMLTDIENTFQQFRGPCYHVLGNHDMDSISKQQFLTHTLNPGQAREKAYYSFEINGVRCIVLDANYNADFSPYDHGNFSWKKAYLPSEEISWLEKQLQQDGMPTLIFIHQLLDRFSEISSSVCVGNAEEAVALIDKAPQVLAVFQGHHHKGHYSHRAGTHYWTMKGMIENDWPTYNSFAIVEVKTNGDIHIQGYKDCESRMLQAGSEG